jgi:AraC-like DNA-binding protein
MGASTTRHYLAGVIETTVPVVSGGRVVALLQIGNVLTLNPSAARLCLAPRALNRHAAVDNRGSPQRAFATIRVIPRAQYALCLQLLAIFAEHLSIVAGQLRHQSADGEFPAVARAKAYILRHQAEKMSLGAVAKAAGASPSHFCKVFKRETGMTLSEFISSLRCEAVKAGLLVPHRRICDIAFDAGFQSLSQFNRVFLRVAGLSPKDYRRKHSR